MPRTGRLLVVWHYPVCFVTRHHAVTLRPDDSTCRKYIHNCPILACDPAICGPTFVACNGRDLLSIRAGAPSNRTPDETLQSQAALVHSSGEGGAFDSLGYSQWWCMQCSRRMVVFSSRCALPVVWPPHRYTAAWRSTKAMSMRRSCFERHVRRRSGGFPLGRRCPW